MERALLGELGPAEQACFEADMASDPELRRAYREAASRASRLDWEHIRSALPPDPKAARPSVRGNGGLWARLDALFPRIPGPIYALSACLLLAAAMLPFLAGGERGLRAKGSMRPQVALEADGVRVSGQGAFRVGEGAILTFAYRSPGPLRAQIWYSEDGAAPRRFDGKEEEELLWPASPEWGQAPQRIQLEGSWKTERIIILASPRPIPAPRAAALAASGRTDGEVSVFTFTLGRP
jgi:hypothetical protein